MKTVCVDTLSDDLAKCSFRSNRDSTDLDCLSNILTVLDACANDDGQAPMLYNKFRTQLI